MIEKIKFSIDDISTTKERKIRLEIYNKNGIFNIYELTKEEYEDLKNEITCYERS